MRAIAASSTAARPADAVVDLAERLRSLGARPGRGDSVALVFATVDLARDPEPLSAALDDMLEMPFIGFVGASVFHDVRLREKQPALCALVLDGVSGAARTATLEKSAHDTAATLLADQPVGSARFLSLAADASVPGHTMEIMPLLDEQHVPIAGSLCVPPTGQRPSCLAARAPFGPSAALLDISGPQLLLGVAQAARPIGPTRCVTACTSNLVQELDGRPAYEALLADLPASLRARVRQLGGALCAGFGTDDGDAFLMRNIVGLDPQTGAVAVAGLPRVGADLVFSLRDQDAARSDLDEMLQALSEGIAGTRRRPLAFVVHDCIGRSQSLFGVQNYDVQCVLQRFGTDAPVVGVAGGGELATYGTRTHLFGMSCVVAALLE